MELMESDLGQLLRHSAVVLTENQIACFMMQLLQGIKALHSYGIVHRDLKPPNILVNSDGQLRIADFGMARHIGVGNGVQSSERLQAERMTEYVVTRWYRAPEVLLAPSVPYTDAIDIWSAGCIMGEMITGKALFPGENYMNQVVKIFKILGYSDGSNLGFPVSAANAKFLRLKCNFPKKPFKSMFPSLSADGRELLEMLLSVDPSRRPSAHSALSSRFLTSAGTSIDYSQWTGSSISVNGLFDFERQLPNCWQLGQMIRAEVAAFEAEATRTEDQCCEDESLLDDEEEADQFVLAIESSKSAYPPNDGEISIAKFSSKNGHFEQDSLDLSNHDFDRTPLMRISADNPFGKRSSASALAKYRPTVHTSTSSRNDNSKLTDVNTSASVTSKSSSENQQRQIPFCVDSSSNSKSISFDSFLSSAPLPPILPDTSKVKESVDGMLSRFKQSFRRRPSYDTHSSAGTSFTFNSKSEQLLPYHENNFNDDTVIAKPRRTLPPIISDQAVGVKSDEEEL